MEDEYQYSQGQVNLIFKHIPARTLLFWADGGFVEVVGERRDGRGRHRLYSRASLYQLGVLENLARIKLPMGNIKEIMENTVFGLNEERIPVIIDAVEKKQDLSIAWGSTFLAAHLVPEKVNWEEKGRQYTEKLAEVKIVVDLSKVARRVDGLIEKAGE